MRGTAVVFGLVAAAGLLSVATTPAMAHGGVYRPPPEDDPPPVPDPPPPPSGEMPPEPPKEPEPPPPPTVTPPETPPDKGIKNPKPGTPTPPDTGGAVPTPPSGPKAPRKPPSSAPTPDGKGGGRRSRGPGLEHWTAWWYFSRDRWLVRQPAGVVSGDSSPGRTAGTSRTNVAAGDAEAPWRARARAALRLSLSSDDVEIFTGCAVALGKAGDVRDAHPLLTVLSRRYRNPQVRESLALGPGLLAPDARGARPALEFILLDKRDSSRLRGFAGISLGLSGDAAALPALLRIAATASDKRDAVAGAVLGLGLLGEPMVLPDLVDMLQDKST
ncbi:MAG: HEAT repeat domain-containing protein, partial [Planctomycetota bacterium]